MVTGWLSLDRCSTVLKTPPSHVGFATVHWINSVLNIVIFSWYKLTRMLYMYLRHTQCEHSRLNSTCRNAGQQRSCVSESVHCTALCIVWRPSSCSWDRSMVTGLGMVNPDLTFAFGVLSLQVNWHSIFCLFSYSRQKMYCIIYCSYYVVISF